MTDAMTHELLVAVSSEIVSADQQVHEIILAIATDAEDFKVVSNITKAKQDISLDTTPKMHTLSATRRTIPAALESEGMERPDQVFCRIGITNLVQGIPNLLEAIYS
jgi:hypothetical protein